MEKYFYLAAGVIIGTSFSFYYLKNEKYSEYYNLIYEDILGQSVDEDSDNEDSVHSHTVTGQSITGQSITRQSIPSHIVKCEPTLQN